jgi:serine/threonine-protein kinase
MPGGRFLHYTILVDENGGESYLAEDTRLHRRVVLRVIPPAASGDEASRERIHRKTRAAARLSHPAIAAVYGVEEDEGRAFVVTEHVEGDSLHDILQRGRLDLEHAFDIAAQVLGALSGAHETGVVHGRLSPRCVVVADGGRVKVLGFGPVEAWGRIAAAAPGYRAPERARDDRAGHRSDLFAFGALLREMFSGLPPLAGIEAIVERCLEKDAEVRYPSAAPIEAELARVRLGRRG